MSGTGRPVHENFASRFGFLFATVGAAIGLGNLWRFPYVTGEYGGGAFVLLYLAMVVFVSLPLVMTELAMGRRGHASPINTLRMLNAQQNTGRHWELIGWLSVLAPLGAFTFYSVVAGWSIDYLVQSLAGRVVGLTPAAAGERFEQLLASPGRLVLWFTVFIALTVFVVARGVRQGIERAVSLMMPALGVMIVILVVYAHLIGAPRAAWAFLFTPDFSRINGEAVLIALGQAFFSVSVGTGALLTYGSYLDNGRNIIRPSWQIALFDTLAAILAGLAIFPIVFASGLDPAEGPGLMFVSLPIALGQMPGGVIAGVVFFTLVFFAALSSSLAMLEPLVAYLEEQYGWRRWRVATGIGACVWLVGLGAALSFNLLADFHPLAFITLYAERTIFDIIDFTVSSVVLPLNVLLITLFAGWTAQRLVLRDEIGLGEGLLFRTWSFLLRWVAPVAIACVLLYGFLGD